MATQLEIMQSVKTAMQTEPGYLFMSDSASKPLVRKGFAEVNSAIENDDCQFATRLTDSGLAFLNSSAPVSVPIPEKVRPMSVFHIATLPIPASKRKGGKGRPSKYPFEQLEVGQMFFVPATEKQSDPAKSLGSVVTSANRKYAVETGEMKTNRAGETVAKLEYTRKFIVRPFAVEQDGELVHGAGIWREK